MKLDASLCVLLELPQAARGAHCHVDKAPLRAEDLRLVLVQSQTGCDELPCARDP